MAEQHNKVSKRIRDLPRPAQPPCSQGAASQALLVSIPPEVLLLIFACLDFRSLASCMLVCSDWAHLIQRDHRQALHRALAISYGYASPDAQDAAWPPRSWLGDVHDWRELCPALILFLRLACLMLSAPSQKLQAAASISSLATGETRSARLDLGSCLSIGTFGGSRSIQTTALSYSAALLVRLSPRCYVQCSD
jgi:hypothetical protein